MDKFLETCKLPSLNQEEIHDFNRQISRSEIKIIKKLQTPSKQKSRIKRLHQTYKELTLILLKHFHRSEEDGTLPNSFYHATITLIRKPDKDTRKK